MICMSDKPERRIILEVLTPESVKRLEARDDELREEITNLNNRISGLHRTIYELIDTIAQLRKK